MGLDPGVTTAIAILDVFGNLLSLYSERNISRGELISYILSFGRPVMVCCDVKNTPKTVKKIATKLGCLVHSPERSLNLAEKNKLTKGFQRFIKNYHELAALAAVIKAWKKYKPLFSRILYSLKKSKREDLLFDVISKVLKEEYPNIEYTIREFNKKQRLSD